MKYNMINLESRIEVVKELLKADISMPGSACSIASEILSLERASEQPNDPRITQLKEGFAASLAEWELEDLLESRIAYALRLADPDDELIFEEMFKLFSLCEEIHELEQIGLSADDELMSNYKDSVTACLMKQPKTAKAVAQIDEEDWNRDLWWIKAATG